MAGGPNDNFVYNPTTWAAILFTVLYGLIWVVQTGQAVHYRTLFMWVMFVACALEFIGFVTRIIAIKEMTTLWPIVVSQTGLIVAPAFIAAQDYMIIGRVMSFVGKEYGYINHTKITKIFVGADIFAILTQAGGGSMLAGANGDLNQMKVAQKVLLTGLALQVITFGIFFFVAVAFDIRSYRAPALQPFREQMKGMRKLWVAFYVSCALITARSIYRTVEFAEIKFTPGNDNADGYLLNHEWPMFVFDSIPILISIIFFSIWHPGAYLPSKKGLRIDGTYEEQFGMRRFLCCGPRKPLKRAPEMRTAESSAIALGRV
ncbi:hypothetical protein FRC04_007677 [Tulasnella sp. 424]|nr:hypothetical protein FRC04_007677 [Tulasnella sp. 424]KAG8979107.1 hypothetical protein FRC05_009317 [Tulasnella sp. 425]